MAIGLLKTFGPVAHYFTFPLVELDGDIAASESYGIAFHRIERDGKTFNCIRGRAGAGPFRAPRRHVEDCRTTGGVRVER